MSERVAISERCMHIFHEVCIKNWVTKHNINCPICKTAHLIPSQLLPNPDFAEQYAQWLKDPENYSLDEQALRPPELRSKKRQEGLNDQQTQDFFKYGSKIVRDLPNNASGEKISFAVRVKLQANDLKLDKIIEDQEEMKKFLQGELPNNPHGLIVQGYKDKLANMQNEVEKRLNQLMGLSRTESNRLLFSLLTALSKNLREYVQRFTEAGQTRTRSREESQSLMAEIDAELEAFIVSQPEAVKAVIGRSGSDSEETEASSGAQSPLSLMDVSHEEKTASSPGGPPPPMRNYLLKALEVMLFAMLFFSISKYFDLNPLNPYSWSYQ